MNLLMWANFWYFPLASSRNPKDIYSCDGLRPLNGHGQLVLGGVEFSCSWCYYLK